MPTYYAILTDVGVTKLAAALATYTPIVFADLAVGDGNGSPITPLSSMTALVNETARVSVNLTEVDPENPNQVRVEGLIPAATGGFTIREAAIFDDDGDMIAIASYPPIYKPTPGGDGVSVEEYIRILLVVESADAVDLTVDTSVVIATRLYVDIRDEIVLTGPAGLGNTEILYLLAADMDGWTYTNSAGVISRNAASSGLILQVPIPLLGRSVSVYQQVKAVSIYLNKADTASLTARLKNVSVSGGSGTDIVTASSSASGAVTITLTADAGIKTGTDEALAVYLTSVAAGDKIYGMKVTWDNELYLP